MSRPRSFGSLLTFAAALFVMRARRLVQAGGVDELRAHLSTARRCSEVARS